MFHPEQLLPRTSLLRRRVNNLLFLLHVCNCPAFRLCFDEAFVQTSDAGIAIISPFAIGVSVVNVEAETRTTAAGGPLQHLQISVGIAKSGDGAPADVRVDADSFTFFVIDKVQLSQANKNRFSISQFKPGLDAAIDDLLGRNTINPLGPGRMNSMPPPETISLFAAKEVCEFDEVKTRRGRCNFGSEAALEICIGRRQIATSLGFMLRFSGC